MQFYAIKRIGGRAIILQKRPERRVKSIFSIEVQRHFKPNRANLMNSACSITQRTLRTSPHFMMRREQVNDMGKNRRVNAELPARRQMSQSNDLIHATQCHFASNP